MPNPVRYPAGVSTYKPANVLATFPNLPSPTASGGSTYEMSPYVGAAFTVTNTTATIGSGVYNAAGAALANGWNGGLVTMAVTTGAGGKAGLAYSGNAATGQNYQFIPGNQVWLNMQVAHSKSLIGYYATGSGALSAGDATTVARYGFMDNVDPTGTISNGVYFELPGTKNTTASAINLVIKNTGLTGSTVTTTILNIADLARPSGIYGDTSSFGGDPAAALTTAGSSNKYTSIAVATAGAGYVQAPLVRTTGASAASPYAQAYCQIQNGYLYAPYLTHVGGTGYTTFTNEVNHWLDLSLYYNGKGVLFVGVNGKIVAAVGVQQNLGVASGAVTNLAAGGTTTGAGAGSYYITNTSMTSSIAPVTPAQGTFDLIMPMSALVPAVGYYANTNNTNMMFVDQVQVASEYN